MSVDPNDNKTVGLPPNLINHLRKPARPGAPESPPAAQAPPVPKAPAAAAPPPPRSDRKAPPERPAAPPAPLAKPPVGPRKPPMPPGPPADRPPDNPWNETILPARGGLWKGQVQAGAPEFSEDSSWWPGVGTPTPPPTVEPVRETPAAPPEARRQQPTPIKAPAPVRELPGTQTIAFSNKGIDPELLAEGKSIAVKVFTKGPGWQTLITIRADSKGQVIGRTMPDASDPARGSLAPEHFRLSWTDGRLQIQEVRTINGVYLRLAPQSKAPLADGSRFRVGPHVLEFRLHEDTATANQSAVSGDGEVFRSVAVKPLAYLDVLGPNAKPSLRIPLTKPDFTDIGRYGGDQSDVVLSDDTEISRLHARIHHKDGQFFLEDLKSSNGTFIRIRGQRALNLGNPRNDGLGGDEVRAGELLLRFVET